MDLTRTRTALHGVAELLMAGPQYATSGVDGVAAFFREGVERAEADPRADGAAR